MGTITYQIPQTGLPNTTEDVKVATALNTLLTLVNGHIDVANLAPGTGNYVYASTLVNAAASDGHLYGCGPGVTLTLTPSPGATIAAFSNGTGASPVTVTAAGGVIYGNGVSGSASVLLGTAQSHLVLYCFNGTDWLIISGQHDTGWVAMTLDPSINPAGGYYTPAARRQGDMIQLRGGATNNTGGNKFGNWATAPAGIRPVAQVVVPVAFSGVPAGELVANTAGGLGSTTVVANGQSLFFDGIMYSAI